MRRLWWDGRVIVPAGADAYAKLVERVVRRAAIAGRSELSLELASIVFQGKTYNVVSKRREAVRRIAREAQRGRRLAAAAGHSEALIGAVAGGGKGAAIGAAGVAAPGQASRCLPRVSR